MLLIEVHAGHRSDEQDRQNEIGDEKFFHNPPVGIL